MPRKKLRVKLQPVYFVDVRFSDVGWQTVASSIAEHPMQEEYDEWDRERRIRENSKHPHTQWILGLRLKRVDGDQIWKVIRSWPEVK